MSDKRTKDTRHNADEFVETVLSVRRVVKVIRGGRRLTFSALVVVGNRNGRIGLATGKSREVSMAIAKALKRARKNMCDIPLYKTTIPYTVEARHGASHVLLRSASKGTGVIAGGAVRALMDAAGIKDVLAKSLGSSNPGNVALATLTAFSKLRSAARIAQLRNMSVKEMCGVDNVTTQ